jgi:ribosome-associated heat shock protein Hsp15
VSDGSTALPSSSVRLDVWLDVACLFKTRSEAQKACTSGKVAVNGQRAKPRRAIRVGDQLQIGRRFGRRQRVIVREITDRHLTKADARRLYEDVTPAPSPQEVQMRQVERQYRATLAPPRAPDRRARRALRRLKEQG